jgi:large subunit ribosomal protein L14e
MKEKARSMAVEPVKNANAFAPGTVCVKIAGRDAGKTCVVTEKVDALFVKVDGFTRARKVNIKHLEPTGKRVDLKGKDVKALLA